MFTISYEDYLVIRLALESCETKVNYESFRGYQVRHQSYDEKRVHNALSILSAKRHRA